MLTHDKTLTISAAKNRFALRWPAQSITWSALLERLKKPIRSPELYKTYLGLPKAKQDALKDVGGYVGGTFEGERRLKTKVKSRSLIALDFDNLPAGSTEHVLEQVKGTGYAAAVYSTRKHRPDAPRLRVLLPAARDMTPDEYEPIARMFADFIGIAGVDPTTFDIARLMYWPSVSLDGEYIFRSYDAPLFDPSHILDTFYENWQDVSEWPTVPGQADTIKRQAERQQEPTEKTGVVGAFCKAYDIPAAIEHFIPHAYTDAGDNRLTYTKGSTTGGAIIYGDGAFLYSHHATDPVSGQLVNAFDLVRLHLYGDQDSDVKAQTPTASLPSYQAMKQLAVETEKVADIIAKEKADELRAAFAEPIDPPPAEKPNGKPAESKKPTDADYAWISELELTGSGNYAKTITNCYTIITKDPALKDRVGIDEFTNRGTVSGSLPWDTRTVRRHWSDVDDAGIQQYIERHFNITGRERIEAALLLASHHNRHHEVREYLNGLTWDGTKRLDTLLIDYLGAEDDLYIRAATRKMLTAAVARVMEPGVKFDYMPIITGPQGCGKSTLVGKLAGDQWFSDSLTTFAGKEASEMLQGIWILELGELTAFSKAESNQVKQFLSKRDDVYREAYGRRTNRFPRQCIFIGTSNETEFLRDTTGNRRFWPMPVRVQEPTKSVWADLDRERDQIWAEAVMRYQLGEPLYMHGELSKLAEQRQEEHKESNPKEGMIRDFLDQRIPPDWHALTSKDRQLFINEENEDDTWILRDRVCVAEIWTEGLKNDLRFLRKMESNEIGGIMRGIPGWSLHKYPVRQGPFGRQKVWVRDMPKESEEEE